MSIPRELDIGIKIGVSRNIIARPSKKHPIVIIITPIKIKNIVELKSCVRIKFSRLFDTPCKVAKYVNIPLTDSIIKILEVIIEVVKKQFLNFFKVISL